jgi:hypothetical protein
MISSGSRQNAAIYAGMMLRRVDLLRATVVALTLLAALPSFGIGRDLTPVRIATPDYLLKSSGLCVTERGFLLRWSSETHDYGTTTDGDGVPRLPASTMTPSTGRLFANGNGCLALSNTGFTDLDASGTVRRTVVFDNAPLSFSAAAFDGTKFFLLGYFGGSALIGRILDQNGHLLATTKPIAGVVSAYDVTASADGGFAVFVADGFAGVYAVQISAAGEITGKADLVIPANRNNRYLAAAATNAGQTVVAWTTSGSMFVHTVALRGGSVVRDTVLPGGEERSDRISLLRSGGGFILLRNGTAGTAHRLLALRLDANGELRDAAPTLLLNGSYGDIAANSRTLVVLGTRDEPNARTIELTATIGENGIVPSATYDVVATAVRQFEPAVASDGVDFFSAWAETTSTTSAIMAGRMTRSGVPLDGTGLVVAEAPTFFSSRQLSLPSVAFGGGVYLVVFAYVPTAVDNKVMGRRYARDGTPIDPAPFVIGSNGLRPSVAYGGGRFLVAWELILSNHVDSVAGATVGAEGPADAAQFLTPAPALQLPEEKGGVGRPAIGWNGRHFIVACTMGGRTRVLRASALGTPLDPHTTAVPNEAGDPTIACSDQECLVGAAYGNDAMASVVHDDAALRADAPRVVVRAHAAALAFDGASYILTWRTADVVALTRITRGGEPYGVAFTETVDSSAALGPAIAANSAGDTVILIPELDPVWLIDRLRFYFASELPQPRRRAV